MPPASSGPSLPAEVAVEDDRARWLSLGIVLIAAFIVVLDTTILNVAIPTIIRDLDTTVAAVEWVVTGYALVFATFLIIGGRLGDVYGHRRIFMIGVALFGIGSFVASISTSVGQLIVGEAVIEGLGASMMLPATIAIMSGTFRGKERATAFAAWGAVAGVGAACGPLIGGFLTTNYSWRWSFRINVIVAPIALIGAWLFVKKGLRAEHKPRIDVPGAAMVAVGMFSLVFALSEGGTYGWTVPIKDFSIAGTVIWPESMPVSFIPLLFLFAVAVLGVFVVVERRKERLARDPLLEFSQFKLKTYRYGLITALILAMGQLGLSFVLPIFLQDAKHLTAAQNGLWQLPTGVSVIIGAQVGRRLISRFGTTVVVRMGLVSYALGIFVIYNVISVDITWWKLLPGLILYGGGIGTAGAQLTNVVMSEIPAESSGVASGANTTARQVGSALGVAVIGSILSVQTIRVRHRSHRGDVAVSRGEADRPGRGEGGRRRLSPGELAAGQGCRRAPGRPRAQRGQWHPDGPHLCSGRHRDRHDRVLPDPAPVERRRRQASGSARRARTARAHGRRPGARSRPGPPAGLSGPVDLTHRAKDTTVSRR